MDDASHFSAIMNAMFIQSKAFNYLLKPLTNPTPLTTQLQNFIIEVVNTMRKGIVVDKDLVIKVFTALRANGGDFITSRREESR